MRQPVALYLHLVWADLLLHEMNLDSKSKTVPSWLLITAMPLIPKTGGIRWLQKGLVLEQRALLSRTKSMWTKSTTMAAKVGNGSQGEISVQLCIF